MTTIRKLIMIVAGLIPALFIQAQVKVSGGNNDVGEIPIQYVLSPAGAVTYQVPVDVYPDPEEFQPQLAFGYNSQHQQGESLLGYGWGVGGLSAITRVSGNLHYDGGTSPLSLAEDKLALDGGICHGACHNESNLIATTPAGFKIYRVPNSNVECAVDPNVTLEVVAEDKGKTWKFILSTGNSAYSGANSGFTTYAEELFRGSHETTGLNFMLVDVDNDGLPDLLKNDRGTIDLYLNKNGKLSVTPNQYATQTLDNLKAQFVMANVAQSYYWSGGLICLDNSYIRVYDYTRKESMERMIRNVTNSHGVKNNHAYVDIMTTAKTRYESGNGNFGLKQINYPYTIMTPHCYVSVWTKRQNGVDVLSWEYYKYINAVFHRKGLGFREFQRIETEDVINSRKIVSTLDPTLLGAEVKRETPTETIDRQYTLDVNPNKTSLLKLQKETREDILNKAETIVTYEYNSYGQPTRSTLSRGMLNREETLNSYLNIDNGTTYLLGLPSASIVNKIRADSTMTQASAMDYNQHYLPSRKTSSINGKTVAEEQFVYNANLRLE